jgi:hypothetical protein
MSTNLGSSGRRFPLSRRAVMLGLLLALVLAGLLALLVRADSGPIVARVGSSLQFAQVDPDLLDAPPAQLERLSWGAVLAGSLIALVIQLGLNLFGIAVGATSIHPESHDSASPQTLATGAAIWVGVSTLISLFIGGWLAARFAGIPNQVDGLLHGVVVWALVMLVSLFFLGSTLGRIISGITSLLGEGLGMMGRAAQTVVQGVGNVAQGVAQGVSNVAQGVGNAAQDAAATVSNKVEDTMRQSPEVNEAMMRLDSSRESIMNEIRDTLREAGLSPQQIENQAAGAGQDVRAAVDKIAENPASANEAINTALNRLFRRAQAIGDAVASETDRETILKMLRERGNMNEEQARQTLAKWEQIYSQARQEFDRVRQEAGGRLQQLQYEAEHKVDEVKHEAERVAREAAQATTQTIAKLATALFMAIVIGGIAAGVGGWFGAPGDGLPPIQTTLFQDGQF